MSLERLLTFWRNTPQIAENITRWERVPARQAVTRPFPNDLHPALQKALTAEHIHSLYSHQAEAWEKAHTGRHVVVATGTGDNGTPIEAVQVNLPGDLQGAGPARQARLLLTISE